MLETYCVTVANYNRICNCTRDHELFLYIVKTCIIVFRMPYVQIYSLYFLSNVCIGNKKNCVKFFIQKSCMV